MIEINVLKTYAASVRIDSVNINMENTQVMPPRKINSSAEFIKGCL